MMIVDCWVRVLVSPYICCNNLSGEFWRGLNSIWIEIRPSLQLQNSWKSKTLKRRFRSCSLGCLDIWAYLQT